MFLAASMRPHWAESGRTCACGVRGRPKPGTGWTRVLPLLAVGEHAGIYGIPMGRGMLMLGARRN